MKPLSITSVLFLTCVISYAQLSDDFSNPTLDDHWYGDISHFIVSDGKMLQLQAPESGASLIHASLDDFSASHWSIDLHLEFSPSPTNSVKIYLSLTDTILQTASGYFLQLGSTGDQDKIQLYQLNSGDEEMIGEGTSAFGTNPYLQIRAQLEDDVLTVSTIQQNHAPIIEITQKLENGRLDPNYFGIYCRYTESRKDKFFFDNIEISDVSQKDEQAPVILEAEIVTSKQLVLYFSEALDKTSAEHVSNYHITPTIGAPRKAMLLADPTMLQLDLNDSLISGQVYQLESRNIADRAGNLHFSVMELQYFSPTRVDLYDLVLSEIHDDPTPTIGLPDAEYIEIYCRKDGITTDGMQLSIGSSSTLLSNRILSKDDLLLIHDIQDSSIFAVYENAMGVKNLPNLTNTGNNIELRTMEGKLIHQVHYDDSWHSNEKRNGGYSLELVNPNDGCALRENWTSSIDLSGGTPGYHNSVRDDLKFTEPRIMNLSPVDQNVLVLRLNKSHEGPVSTNEVLVGPAISLNSVEVFGSSRNNIRIQVEPKLARGIQYDLVLSGWKDCAEQSYTNNPINFLLPEDISPGDLVINEVLFDPVVGAHDFVEIYNVSDKALSLQDILLINTDNSKATSFEEPFVMLPATYLVFTENAKDLASRYTIPQPNWVVESSLPPLNNDAGNITILSTTSGETVIIDKFDYDVGLHNALLKETEGVSLERLYPESMTQSSGNWHSAAQSAGYATPTGPNSQTRKPSSMMDHWNIEPDVFSPDGDGYDDYALIRYKDLEPGNYLHIKIYDSAGRLISYLANNLSLQTEGEIKWDGSTEAGRKAAVGIYIIFIQLFNSNGIVSEIKETCVVAAPLK